MSFHLGKPILVMLVLSLVTGAFVAHRPPRKSADLSVWIFVDNHFKEFAPMIPAYEKRSGLSINLSLVSAQAMDLRLSSLFLTDPMSRELPDLVEIEIGWVGKYLRPPIDQIGFLPLNDM